MHNFQCFKCDSNCKTCSGASTKCTSCVNRKYLTFNRTCEKCIETCIYCSFNATHCLGCIEGYDLFENKSCVENIFVKAKNNLINNENITQKLFASSGNKPVILEEAVKLPILM